MKPFKVKEYGAAENGIVFVFGGWRFSRLFYRAGIWRMNRYGLKCVLFIPKSNLISVGTSYQVIVDAIGQANEIVSDYLREYQDEPVHLAMGISFGTLFALEIAKRQASINRVILSAPFGDFDEHIRGWSSHWYFGRVLRSQPGGIDGASKTLKLIDPTSHVEKLKGKQVLLCYAKADKIVHPAATEKLIALLHQTDVNVTLCINKGGHHRGISRDYWWLMTQKQDIFAS
jgi:hypothetical protein